jgi:hypothetical protein
MKLSILFLVTGALGVTASMTDTGVVFFCVAASLFFTCIGIGGVRKYVSQENVDVRDIYREKDLLQKEKISILSEKLIEAQKQIILLSAKIKEQQPANISNTTTRE